MAPKFGIRVDKTDMIRFMRVLRRLGEIDSPRLSKEVADVIVRQTKDRINKTKRDPHGVKWKKWSPSYAETRNASHSLLKDTEDLERGIEARVAGNRISIGVLGADYAPHVQRVRPFFGIGQDDGREIMAIIERRVEKVVDGAA
jgi:phage gpG-like protein